MGNQVKRNKDAAQLYVIDATVYSKGQLNTRIDLKDIVDLTSPDIIAKITEKLDKRYRKKGYSNPMLQDSSLEIRVNTLVKGDENGVLKEAEMMLWAENQKEALQLAARLWNTVYSLTAVRNHKQYHAAAPVTYRPIPTPILNTSWGYMDRIKTASSNAWFTTPKTIFLSLASAGRGLGPGVHQAVREASRASLIKIHADPLEYAVQAALGSEMQYMLSCDITLDTTVLDKMGEKYYPDQVKDAEANIDTFVKAIK